MRPSALAGARAGEDGCADEQQVAEMKRMEMRKALAKRLKEDSLAVDD